MTRRQVLDLGGTLPLAIENGKMQFFVPFPLEQRMFAVMRFEPHTQLLHELDGVMIAPVAAHEQAMDTEMLEGQVEDGAQRFPAEALPGKGRVDAEPNLALPRRRIRPVQGHMADKRMVTPTDHREGQRIARTLQAYMAAHDVEGTGNLGTVAGGLKT